MNQAPVPESQRLPVAVLTGFLGSGKTTLLNRLLHHPEMGDAAVIVNEFGEVGIDNALIEASNEDIVLLPSGCLCCTVRGDLVNTLRDLSMKRVLGAVPPFRRVIIETTGLADPAPIIHTLMTLPVTQRYRLDVVLTTVDAVNGEATLNRYAEALKQAAVADRLLLTKTDLATQGAAESLLARLKLLNPAAPVALADDSLAPSRLFDTALYDPATKTVDVQNWLRAEAYSGHATRAQELQQRHADGIDSFCTIIDEPLEWRHIAAWLDLLAGHRGERLLRVKGIFNVRDVAGPIVIHAVQHLFHPPVQLEHWPDADRRSRVVFITRDLPRHIIEETLATLRQAHCADAPSLTPN